MSSKCEKWGYKVEEAKDLYVVLFISRNKDNRDILNFKERRRSFVTTKSPHELTEEFHHFVEDGVDGEICRMYYSVNARDAKKVRKELIKFLVDDDNFNIAHLGGKIAGIAASKECAATKHWMFDFDEDDKSIYDFVSDIRNIDPSSMPNAHKTPNGYAVIVEHGFDTRWLMAKWGKIVTLKRDDLLCYRWSQKDESI